MKSAKEKLLQRKLKRSIKWIHHGPGIRIQRCFQLAQLKMQKKEKISCKSNAFCIVAEVWVIRRQKSRENERQNRLHDRDR